MSKIRNRPQYNRMDRVVTTRGKRAKVRLPNASTFAYGKWEASPGDVIVFDDDGHKRIARVVGRVDANGSSGDPVKGHLCVVALSDLGSFAFERWIDPALVLECTSVDRHVEFFRAFFTADPALLLRMSEYGSLGARRSNTIPQRFTDDCPIGEFVTPDDVPRQSSGTPSLPDERETVG